MLFAVGFAKFNSSAIADAIQRENRSRHRTRTQRTNIQPLAAVVQPIQIAQEHFDIRQQPMRYQHRLGALQVGVSRHDILACRFRLLHELADKLDQQLRNLVDLLAYIQPQVGGNLLVAAAAGVQLSSPLRLRSSTTRDST